MTAGPAKAGIGPVLGVILVATTMIGSGIFLLPATLAAIGTISVLGWLLAATGAMLIGLTMAWLASVSPYGFLDAIGQVFGPFAGQAAALAWVLAFPLVNAAIAVAAGGNVGFLVPSLAAQPTASWVATGFVALMTLCAHLGARMVARVGGISLLAGLLPILIVILFGIGHFDADLFRAGWNVSGASAPNALFQAAILCFWAFLGLESASLVSRQIRDPHINVPVATVGGVLLATIVYLVATTVIAGMIPADVLAQSTAPFADATVLIIGPVAAALVAVAAAMKASGTLGASLLGGAESWLCVQRQLRVPGVSFATANLVGGILAAGVVWATASPTLGGQYGVLISVVVVLTLLIYGLAGLALARVRAGLARWVGLAAAAFSFGLVATQRLEMLWLAAGLTAATIAAVWLWNATRARLA